MDIQATSYRSFDMTSRPMRHGNERVSTSGMLIDERWSTLRLKREAGRTV